MKRPLEGVKVVELATFVAAPVCCRLLADMGAEVIKVEAPAGDGWRYTSTTYTARFNNDQNPIFDIYNTGKKHAALNLKTPEGMEAMHRLLSQADIFVTNTRPAALKRLGLDQETLREKYPSMIYGIVLGYGEKGPYADRVAFDTSAFWAKGGFNRSLSPACDDYAPLNFPSGVGDTYTGYLLLGEIMAALYNRTRTGKGDYVRSTLFRNAVFCMGSMSIRTQEGVGGSTYPHARKWGAPAGSYETSDGEWIHAPGAEMDEVAKLVEMPELATDPRFTPDALKQHIPELYYILKDIYIKKPHTHWLQKAKELDMPLVHMLHFADVVNDEQCWANGYLEKVKFRDGYENVMPASPIEMESFTAPPTKPAPLVGGDTVEVLKALGYDDETVEKMLQSGAAVKN